MTASPTVNGHKRSAMPVFGDWQPVPAAAHQQAPASEAGPQPTSMTQTNGVDPRAEAEAEATRARTAAETAATHTRAEAEAEAIRVKAAAEAEKQRLANERTAMRLEKERADHAAKIAETNRRREETERQRREANETAAAEKHAAAKATRKRESSSRVWFWCALVFAVACAIVALPVQMAAFWSPDAKWLLAAPVMLEGAAWVVLMGAASAVAAGRPHWHYRLIAWLLAFVAAGINLTHGLHAFDPATAIGTAFASVAGPGVWDLHEHGRIRARDGKPTRAERREKRRVEKAAAKERKQQEQDAADAAEELAAVREERFPKVWDHAVELAAALGQTTVTEEIWRRAHRDIEGAEPGESVDVVRVRNAAERRMLNARNENPDRASRNASSSQRDPQMPPSTRRGSKAGPPVRGTRRAGDTPKYVSAARKQAAITAKSASARGSR